MGDVTTPNGKVLMLFAAWLTATGQLFWKLGYENYIYMMVGFICYGVGALLMIKALSLEKLSVAYPILCLSYVFALLYGALILNEKIILNHIIAVFLISIGVTFTSYDK